MSKFRSAYSSHVRHTSLTGNGHEPEYEYKVTETGRELVKTGENDVYALIQSRLEETKIENIIKRATYDPTSLGDQEWQNSAQMVDITDVPTNYHEWYGRIKDAEAEFDKLPIISIHALREEGDSKNRDKISIFKQIIQHSARI